jgi:hypothetical protein
VSEILLSGTHHLLQVFTCEPQHIKAILATQFAAFEKGPAFRDIFNPLLGTGVFAADGTISLASFLGTESFILASRLDVEVPPRHDQAVLRQASYQRLR